MSRKDLILNEILEVKNFLNKFLRHPMTEIKSVPDWHWYRLIGLHATLAAICGALTGLVEKKISFSIIAGLILTPILTMITLGVATLFFYYCFQIFVQKTVSVRKLATVIVLANIPQMILQVVSGYVPPITLVGMAFTALLLLVGFVENFQIDRKMAMRLIGGLYAIFIALWLWNQASSARFEKSWNSDRMEAPEVHLGE